MKRVTVAKNRNWGLIVTALFVLAILFLFPVWSSFQIDADEGVNLGKAMLLEQGYELYNDIWSDQPPVLTYILAGIIRLFSYNVVLFRLVTVGFSGLLFWLSFRILSRHASLGAALIGTILLIASDPFIRVSYAVMIGLPAISLALFSLFAIMQWHRSSKNFWLWISALILALSVMTKLFTGILAPIIFLGLLITNYRNRDEQGLFWKTFQPSITWATLFTVILLLIIWLAIGFENVQQLIDPHLNARSLEIFQTQSFSVSKSLLVLSGLSVVLLMMDKKWLFLYPISWMLVSYALLKNHSPAWYHQDLLFTVPASLVAAFGVSEGFRNLIQLLRRKMTVNWSSASLYLSLASIFFFLMFLNSAFPPKFAKNINSPIFPIQLNNDFNENRNATLDAIHRYSEGTELIFTDQPMYAIRSGISLLPHSSSIVSGKRYLTGDLTDKQIIIAIAQFAPEQVLLGRFEYPEVVAYLVDDYVLITYEDGKVLHYVLDEILE
jgi:4-amino-4-deoxy-L-arabinose transferase-like glycosyltransferase